MARGITIYRGDERVDLDETDMMSVPTFREDFVRPENANPYVAEGQEVKVLFRQGDDEGGFSLTYAWFKPNFMLPRHSHSADCLYYVLSGVAVLGSQELTAGDGFFVPAGAPYGYSAGPEGVEVLEFRNATSFDMQITDSTERYAAIFDNAAEHGELWRTLAGPQRS
jgi:quercetin dioxygenase-like cupin family protein